MEFARTKAELLHAAEQAGKANTPELEAEIDRLADAYAQAGLEAQGAAEKLDQIKERSQAGKDALSDMFGSIFDGSMSAKDAVGQLLMEIAKMQFMKGMTGLIGGMGGGGLFGAIGGLLLPGFAAGGQHSGGLRIVGEKGPELEATGASRIWSADQTRNLLAGKSATASPAASSQTFGGKAELVLHAPPGFTSQQIGEIEGISVRVVSKSAPEVIGQSVQATRKSMRKSKAGWGI